MLPNHLSSTVFMSLANRIPQWNSGYLQTDSPASQVFDQSGPESPSLTARSELCSHPTSGSAPGPGPRRAPGHRPAQHQPLRVRGCRATGGAGRSATGHPDGQCALRGRPARRRGFGAAGPVRGCGPLGGAPAGSPGQRLGRRRAARAEPRGFGHPGGRSRRDGLGGSWSPRLWD